MHRLPALLLLLAACGSPKDGGDLVDADADGYGQAVDCDDAEAAVHPGAEETWYDGIDQDCDGRDDDQDGDGHPASTDCDDTDPSVYPEAGEVPDDGVDQDCDGVDSSGGWGATDEDGDGYSSDVDCDDTDPYTNPGAEEAWYDGVDQDCDGRDDDRDADGYALADDCDDMDPATNPGAGEVPGDGIDQNCDGADAEGTLDRDGDGYSSDVDCDDSDASVHPGATEVWYDGVDQDCDRSDDDQDGDGYPRAEDCDDTAATVYPGAGEIPGDTIDQDCNGADLPATGAGDDADGDGYAESVDCNDANSGVHPGAAEVWYDGVDQDCDGVDDDRDGDGYPRAEDCDDADAGSYPDAPEVADDFVDQDCDGTDMLSADALLPGDVVVTELLRKPSAVDDAYGEWIEVYNASGQRVLLDGLVVSSDAQLLEFTVEGGVEIAAGGFAVLAREGESAINGGVVADYDYRTDFGLDNDADTLTLSSAGSGELDVVAWDDDAAEADPAFAEVAFFPDLLGASMSLDRGHVDRNSNDNGQYWCDGAAAFGAGDLGTPGAANPSCANLTDGDADGFVAAHDCNDRNGAIHPTAVESARDGTDSDCDGADFRADALRSGELVISEIMQNPDVVADADGEWFEVYNNTSSTVNLVGLGVGDALAVSFVVESDVLVASHGYAVFAVDGDPLNNGGVTTVSYDYPGSTFSLTNGADEVYLYAGAAVTDTGIDAVEYDGLGAGKGFPDPVGASMMLKSTAFTSSGNDNPTNWCTSTSPIGGDVLNDLGTPGAANDRC